MREKSSNLLNVMNMNGWLDGLHEYHGLEKIGASKAQLCSSLFDLSRSGRLFIDSGQTTAISHEFEDVTRSHEKRARGKKRIQLSIRNKNENI